jgi:hypothetical protein
MVTVAVAAVAAVAVALVLLQVLFLLLRTVFSNLQHVRVGMCEQGIHFGLKKPSQAS